jgi:hypothetical protein
VRKLVTKLEVGSSRLDKSRAFSDQQLFSSFEHRRTSIVTSFDNDKRVSIVKKAVLLIL